MVAQLSALIYKSGMLENEYEWFLEEQVRRRSSSKLYGETVDEILALISILYNMNCLWPQLVPTKVWN